MMELINFVNMGTDERILKSLPVEDCPEELVKAMNKQGLVQKEVTVQGANGKTFTRKQWVRASDAQSISGQQGSQQNIDLEQKARHMLDNCDIGDVLGTGVNRISIGRVKNPNTGDWEMTYTVKATGYSVSYTEAVKILSQSSDPKMSTLTQKAAPGSARQDFYGVGNFYNVGKSGNFAKDMKFLDSQPDGVTVKIRYANRSETYARKSGKNWITDTGSKLTSNDVTSSAYTDGAFVQVNYMVKTKPQTQSTSTPSTKPQAKPQTQSKPQGTTLGISFDMPAHGDTKKAMADLLASGKSRDDIMSAAKAAGITWISNDNPGINWMRASMAIQKHMKSGTKQPAGTSTQHKSKDTQSQSSVSTKKPKIFTEAGGIKDVTRGGRGGQYMIHRKAASKYIMLQATKKDGSWGKPSRTELYGNETPEDALKRMQDNNPGHQWRFDPDSMEN